MIRQDTKDSFLSLSDLNEAYIRAREINGWSEKRLNEILQRDSNIERIYYVIREQIFNENDKYAKTRFYESFKDCSSFKEYVKETDYAERIYGQDCLPTTMISESGIDKIYNCYDR